MAPRNYVELYRQAAEQGHALAQRCLGAMYEAGRGGLAKDEARAVELWRQAAEQGDALAQCNLGVMYATGRGGLAKDEARAVELYRQAAEQGDARAQRRLGGMYEAGRGGLATDKVRALDLLTKALQDERVRPHAQRVLSRLRSHPSLQHRGADAESEVSGAPSEVAPLADLDDFDSEPFDDHETLLAMWELDLPGLHARLPPPLRGKRSAESERLMRRWCTSCARAPRVSSDAFATSRDGIWRAARVARRDAAQRRA